MKFKSFTSCLRHKIILECKAQTEDGAGGFETQWVEVTVLWASIERVRASENYAGGKLRGNATHRFCTRYVSDMTADMRLVFGERVFNIRHIHNPGEKNNTLEIFAEEGVAP